MRGYGNSGIARACSKVGPAVAAAMVLMHAEPVWAGWSASVNGAGVGWSYVNVTSAVGGFYNSKSSSGTYPSSSIPSGSPMYASSSTYANAVGYSGGIVKGSASG